MKYHLALGRLIDLESIAHDAEVGICPRHVMWGLSQRLGATIHQPSGHQVSFFDKMRSQVSSLPEHWAIARTLSARLDSGDTIFCTGEDIGIPVATLCGTKRNRPKIAVFFHNIDRPRGHLALKLFGLADKIDLFVSNARPQLNFIRNYLGVPESRLLMLPEQTDTAFFTPGTPTPDKIRPIIASVGLEKRDYRPLAEATADLNVDVKISGFSKDAIAMAQAFPESLPANMSRRFYSWPELVQLYRDADVVAVSVTENKFCAGLTSMLEAMAIRRPVVVTRTQGLADYLAPPGIATVVNPGDAEGLREAISNLLNNPQAAEAQAIRGYELILQQHTSEQYIEVLAARLASL
ncbi:MAG TPA: glycosyltransferase family 4 protein [Kamptonema sp.]|nr:glycosyltransferase family 4 protein [Kamptonema sp.]